MDALSPQLVTNTWLCGNILRVFVKSVVTGKKNWCQHAMQNYQYLYESTACWHQFLFLWEWGGGGGWFVTDSHNRLHWKGQSADSLRFAWWCAFLELLSLYQDIIFQMCMIAKPNSGQVMMTLQQQRYPICFFILTC